MIEIALQSDDDPLIADYRAVREADLVRGRGLFVAEGRLVVGRLIRDGRCAIRSLLLAPAARTALDPDLQYLREDVPVFLAAADVLRRIAGFDVHRGCLALAERPPQPDPDALLASASRVVVLESVGNADNVGGVFRNAAAFGADAVLLSPACCDPLYRKAIRTSMAAAIRVPFSRMMPWPESLALLGRHGFMTVALSPAASLTLEAFCEAPATGRVALLLGTEGTGLSPAASQAADVRVRIPIRPDVDSLNLAVAAGIALYRLCRTGGRPGAPSASGDR